MHIIEAKVRKCFGERVFLDKMMNEHRWRYRKYLIVLEDDQPFDPDAKVKIITENDFEEIKNMLKQLTEDKSLLKRQLKDLKKEIKEKDVMIGYLKNMSHIDEVHEGVKNLF